VLQERSQRARHSVLLLSRIPIAIADTHAKEQLFSVRVARLAPRDAAKDIPSNLVPPRCSALLGNGMMYSEYPKTTTMVRRRAGLGLARHGGAFHAIESLPVKHRRCTRWIIIPRAEPS